MRLDVLVRLLGANGHSGQQNGGGCDRGYKTAPGNSHDGPLFLCTSLVSRAAGVAIRRGGATGKSVFPRFPKNFLYPDSIPNSSEELFRANLALVERVIGGVCRRAGLRDAVAEDFSSTVKLALIENDYAILRGYE